jgi:hypothetical protein
MSEFHTCAIWQYRTANTMVQCAILGYVIKCAEEDVHSGSTLFGGAVLASRYPLSNKHQLRKSIYQRVNTF